MPDSRELIAFNREDDAICREIKADALIYQSLDDLKDAVREENPELTDFEDSIFSGKYVVNPSEHYFEDLANVRSDDAKAEKAWKDANDELDIHNINN